MRGAPNGVAADGDVTVRELDTVVAELNFRVFHLRRLLEGAKVANTNDPSDGHRGLRESSDDRGDGQGSLACPAWATSKYHSSSGEGRSSYCSFPIWRRIDQWRDVCGPRHAAVDRSK